jgi:hypothetical protein
VAKSSGISGVLTLGAVGVGVYFAWPWISSLFSGTSSSTPAPTAVPTPAPVPAPAATAPAPTVPGGGVAPTQISFTPGAYCDLASGPVVAAGTFDNNGVCQPLAINIAQTALNDPCAAWGAANAGAYATLKGAVAAGNWNAIAQAIAAGYNAPQTCQQFLEAQASQTAAGAAQLQQLSKQITGVGAYRPGSRPRVMARAYRLNYRRAG